MNDNFYWLLQWYYNQCDGDWEHGSGIHMDSIDNPGWSITINLDDTVLQDKKFEKIKYEHSENNWKCCFVTNRQFEGRCGPLNLPEVLQIFREWAESCQEEPLP